MNLLIPHNSFETQPQLDNPPVLRTNIMHSAVVLVEQVTGMLEAATIRPVTNYKTAAGEQANGNYMKMNELDVRGNHGAKIVTMAELQQRANYITPWTNVLEQKKIDKLIDPAIPVVKHEAPYVTVDPAAKTILDEDTATDPFLFNAMAKEKAVEAELQAIANDPAAETVRQEFAQKEMERLDRLAAVRQQVGGAAKPMEVANEHLAQTANNN